MARQISRTEAWERAHEIFTQVNFNAFDFNSIKESLLDYTKLYFPEDFNDYIESSEFVAILELFAYVGELLAYRLDLNAHENFITTAERKESILRLAKLISYKASRNIPARGLVKMTSIQTTETVIDSQGRNLANRRITWNDPNNPDWKEQFLLVTNRVLEQEFGTVAPNERVQIEDVLFELYTFNNNPFSGGIMTFSYSVSVSGQSYPMELVPVALTENGPEEKRPEIDQKLSILYANDGLGDGSDTTGFLLFTKQGNLTFDVSSFDGITPNQTFEVNVNNINETDIWLNNVDADSGEILVDDPYETLLPHLVAEDLRFGEWVEVDLANAQNILFNTNKNRHKYEIETLDNDQIRLIFGDGEFSDIPSGTFHVWYRTSANTTLAIPRSSVANQSTSFTYNDVTGNVQTITFTFSLVSSLLNASPSETLEHIRRVAPSVYYTQDRMVNGRDYNVFMLQDPSILKLRAINRTFAGDSKYIAWHDPRENYEDVKLFGDDVALYWIEKDPNNGALSVVNRDLSANQLLEDIIEPLLSTTDFFAKIGPELEKIGANPGDIRRVFTNDPYSFDVGSNEIQAITNALNNAISTTGNPVVDLFYSVIYDEWTVGLYPNCLPSEGGSGCHPCDVETKLPPDTPDIGGCVAGPAGSIWMIRVEARFEGPNLSGWDVRWRTRRQIAHSEVTRFWNTNDTNRIVVYDTLNTQTDTIVVLQANINADGDGLLDSNRNFAVLGQELVEQNLPNAGLPDIHRLSVLPEDVTGDGIADNLSQPLLFDAEFTKKWPVEDGVYWVNTQTLELLQRGTPLPGCWNSVCTLSSSPPCFSSTTQPSVPVPSPDDYWYNPTTGQLFQRNTSNTVWVEQTVISQDTDPLFDDAWQLTFDPVDLAYYIDLAQVGKKYNNSSEKGFDNDIEVYVSGVRYEFEPAVGFADLAPPSNQSTELVVSGIRFTNQNSSKLRPVSGDTVRIVVKDYVYFSRESSIDPWVPIVTSDSIRSLFLLDDAVVDDDKRYIRREGRYPLNFAWFHFTPRLNLVDPSATNIIDIFIITLGYFTALRRWLENKTDIEPALPTPLELRTTYASLIDNKMISDTVILHPGQFKILFGSRAISELRAKLKIVRPALSNLTDNQVKVRVVDVIRDFFNPDNWSFGESFFFTELAASIHAELGPEIDSVVLVPTYAQNQFGDMFQVQAREDELFYPDINTTDLEIVQSLTPDNIRQNES